MGHQTKSPFEEIHHLITLLEEYHMEKNLLILTQLKMAARSTFSIRLMLLLLTCLHFVQDLLLEFLKISKYLD